MYSIEQVINIIKESNYFTAWESILISDTCIDEWQLILQNDENEELYNFLADKLYKYNVPYVIVSEYIDEFFRYYENGISRHKIKNKIAQAYLKKKLIDDSNAIDIELNKKLSITLESKKLLINAHLKWMQSFIYTIIGQPRFFELDPTKCTVGKWLIEEKEYVSPELIELHRNLHSMTESAMRMYNRDDYAYFLLLYLDILMSSYKIRDTIINIYFHKRFSSIFRDILSNQPNYFQLKYDIQNNSNDCTILMFNIKEFSKINLLYGHEAGDKIIKDIADFIASLDNVTKVYRIYGDEFAVIFPTKYKETFVSQIQNLLHEHEFDIADNKILLSFYGSVATVSEHVLERCEYGLMISKTHYGEISDVDSIDEELLKEYANHITLSQQLRLAFLDNRIITHYQPIMDLKTGKITKYETLMRVEDLQSNILVPKDFLEVLQGMYIYPEVTKLIIKNTFEVFKDNEYEFSINLSFADIINLETEAFVLAMIKEYPDVAKRCTFELLENEAIHNYKEVNDFFSLLHEKGVKIALDDFGVGYSNYDTIFKFDIDYIKIDGSLTESILTSNKSKVLIESIITVAKKLNAKLIVEFVSSKEIFDAVSKLDVDYVQGYYIGKPASGLL